MNIDQNTQATVAVKQVVNFTDVGDLLCSALEGGSNYWYTIEEFIKPHGTPDQWPVRSSKEEIFRHLDYPLNPGGALVISDFTATGFDTAAVKSTKKTVNREVIVEALQKYADKYPDSFARWQDGDYDAADGDLFLQIAVLGEVIYG